MTKWPRPIKQAFYYIWNFGSSVTCTFLVYSEMIGTFLLEYCSFTREVTSLQTEGLLTAASVFSARCPRFCAPRELSLTLSVFSCCLDSVVALWLLLCCLPQAFVVIIVCPSSRSFTWSLGVTGKQRTPACWLTFCGVGVWDEKRFWRPIPTSGRVPMLLSLCFSGKNHLWLPNYAALRIIMVHKHKNEKSNADSFCRHLSHI